MLTLTNPQIAVAVVVVALITFACRIAPFALLRGRSTSPLLGFLSSAMPLGVMVVLVGWPESRRRRACTCGAARSACR